MAISPPSDIVLDVARAVDQTELDAARTALAKRVGASAPAGTDAAFSVSVGHAVASPGASRDAASGNATVPFKRFEAMVLETFIQTMLPQDAEAVYGEGMAGDMWKSMMAGKVAEVVADRGGIGIASQLLGDHYMDGENRRALGPISRGPERTEIDTQSMLSGALVQEMQRRATDAMGGEKPGPSTETPS